jgi:methyl-accepting chemotaxis protein
MNRQIAAAAKQQAAASLEINQSVLGVSEQNALVVTEVDRARAMAEEFRQLVV